MIFLSGLMANNITSGGLLTRKASPMSGAQEKVTDKLRNFGIAHRELIPGTVHDTSQYANNRGELSRQPTKVRERGMRGFKSTVHVRRLSGVHASVYN